MIIRRFLYPGAARAVILSVVCAATMTVMYIYGWQDIPASPFLYALTTYAFIAFILNAPQIAVKSKTSIYKSKLGKRYLTDMPFQMKVTLVASLTVNLLYAAVKLYSGVYYASFWYGADALYFLVLSLMRFLLLRHVRKNERDPGKAFRRYRLCGVLLFALNAAFISVIVQIVNQGMTFRYPGFLIYAVCIYTFYSVIISCYNIVRRRGVRDPIMSAQKTISLVRALVAMFALQTAMFASFNSDITLERSMNLITGICVCCAIFYLAVFMVIRANIELKKLNGHSIAEITEARI